MQLCIVIIDSFSSTVKSLLWQVWDCFLENESTFPSEIQTRVWSLLNNFFHYETYHGLEDWNFNINLIQTLVSDSKQNIDILEWFPEWFLMFINAVIK